MLSHRKGVLLDGIGSELVRASTGGSRKTLSKWLGDLSNAINLGDVASTFTSGDATPSVLNNSKFITDGSTTITNFDDGVEGQTITVYRGSSDIGIADNANIDPIIAGTLTLSTARPSATFRLASGVWKQVEEAGSIATTFLPVVQALTLAASLTAAGLGTGDTPLFAGVSVGNADTTLTRVSAGVAAIEGDTIATLAQANLFAHATGNTFRGRINSDPAYAVYSGGQATMLTFGTGTHVVGASDQLDLIYSGNTFTVGASGIAHVLNMNVTVSSGSDASANVRGVVTNMSSAGPATVSGMYSHVAGSGSSVGDLVAIKNLVTPGASTANAINLQVAFDTTARKVDKAISFNSNAGVASVDYGLVAGVDVSFGVAVIQAAAVGAADFLVWKNSTASANLFTVTSTGALVSASTLTGTVLTGTTSLIASSASNGITIDQATVSRNHVNGSLTISAGTAGGNSLAFNTGNAVRLALSDTGASITGVCSPATDATHDLGTTAASWRAAYLTDGLYVDDVRVVKEQGALVADASGGAVIDAEARTAINALLARVRAHGLIAT